ncbi:alpha/beta hydrolase [Microbacterium sp. Marseille-Q6648]|uniref:alpha/beta hydrolase fold domain-containing protein n=1 Tax=Microbacterium sp. Marseille-Q6648 TaxID=2937991 RepID=UPI002557CB17|nr:alpha/beta hydrolase [Microbacterium sp. Marseille-Q6648]
MDRIVHHADDGGAWVMDMQGIQYGLVAGLLKNLDADITMAIYPLAPERHWKETMAFCRDLYLEMVEEHGAESIVITGDSAGGNIAMLLAQSLRDDGGPLPAALVLYSPVLDLSASGHDQAELERRDPSVTRSLIRNGAALWAPGLEPKDPRISPLYADQAGLPPTLIFTGDREVLDSDARRLVEVNPEVDHRCYAEMAHVFPIGGTRESAHAFRETAAFVARETRKG